MSKGAPMEDCGQVGICILVASILTFLILSEFSYSRAILLSSTEIKAACERIKLHGDNAHKAGGYTISSKAYEIAKQQKCR